MYRCIIITLLLRAEPLCWGILPSCEQWNSSEEDLLAKNGKVHKQHFALPFMLLNVFEQIYHGKKGINIHREAVCFWREMLLNIEQSRNTDDLFCWRLETAHFILHSVWCQNSPVKRIKGLHWSQCSAVWDNNFSSIIPIQFSPFYIEGVHVIHRKMWHLFLLIPSQFSSPSYTFLYLFSRKKMWSVTNSSNVYYFYSRTI